MSLLSDNARRILHAALAADVGIVVLVEVPDSGAMIQKTSRAKQVLYRFKSEDAIFADLKIDLDPDDPDNRLWILKKDA